MYAILSAIKAKLAAVPGIKTAKIGLETGISSDDYPIARLVVSKIQRKERKLWFDLLVYFGAARAESDAGLEQVYADLLALEDKVIAAVHYNGDGGNKYLARYVETITDEDRLQHFKVFCARFEVQTL